MDRKNRDRSRRSPPEFYLRAQLARGENQNPRRRVRTSGCTRRILQVAQSSSWAVRAVPRFKELALVAQSHDPTDPAKNGNQKSINWKNRSKPCFCLLCRDPGAGKGGRQDLLPRAGPSAAGLPADPQPRLLRPLGCFGSGRHLQRPAPSYLSKEHSKPPSIKQAALLLEWCQNKTQTTIFRQHC